MNANEQLQAQVRKLTTTAEELLHNIKSNTAPHQINEEWLQIAQMNLMQSISALHNTLSNTGTFRTQH